MSATGMTFGAALLRREATRWWLAALAGAAFAAVYAAAVVADAVGAPVPDTPQLVVLRRFDLLAVAAAALTGCLRAATRLGEDHASGWLVPYFTMRPARAGYAVALAGIMTFTSVVLCAAAALPFATTLLVRTGSSDLLATLPRVLGGGAIIIAGTVSVTVLVGLLVRSAAGTVLLTAVLVFAPYVAAATYLLRGEVNAVPAALRLWVLAAPPLTIARSAAELTGQAIWLAAALGALACTAAVRAGRRP